MADEARGLAHGPGTDARRSHFPGPPRPAGTRRARPRVAAGYPGSPGALRDRTTAGRHYVRAAARTAARIALSTSGCVKVKPESNSRLGRIR